LLSSFGLVGGEFEILRRFKVRSELYAQVTSSYFPQPALNLLSRLHSLEKLHLMSIQPSLLRVLLSLPNLKELFLASGNHVRELEERGVVVFQQQPTWDSASMDPRSLPGLFPR
jgi:hypothetical protein